MDALDEEDAASLNSYLLKKPSLKNDLSFISAHFSHLPAGITKLEEKDVLLSESI
jgi:hypothetical protein